MLAHECYETIAECANSLQACADDVSTAKAYARQTDPNIWDLHRYWLNDYRKRGASQLEEILINLLEQAIQVAIDVAECAKRQDNQRAELEHRLAELPPESDIPADIAAHDMAATRALEREMYVVCFRLRHLTSYARTLMCTATQASEDEAAVQAALEKYTRQVESLAQEVARLEALDGEAFWRETEDIAKVQRADVIDAVRKAREEGRHYPGSPTIH